VIGAVLERADPRDALDRGQRFAAFATCRARRASAPRACGARRSCWRLRPDLRIEALRGNVDTRLRRLDDGELDAIVLACAGLVRLGWESRITQRLDPSISLPAVGQGVIGIECRSADSAALDRLRVLEHAATRVAMDAERAFSRRLGGSCQSPIAAHARVAHGRVILDGLVAEPDGSRLLRDTLEGAAADSVRWAGGSPSACWPPARARCSSGCAPVESSCAHCRVSACW
jgi:hydroxymethylbilane synthase